MKHVLLPDHIPTNKYVFTVAGLPPITFTSVGALEEEIDKIDLPDRTAASGGRTKPVEFDVKVPSHHAVEIAAMEAWYEEGQDPVSPTYKKVGTLAMISLTGAQQYVATLIGIWNYKRGTPELEMNSDGELTEITYSLCTDQVIKA